MRRTGLIVAIGALALAGCGNGGTDTTTTTAPAGTTTTAPATTTTAAATTSTTEPTTTTTEPTTTTTGASAPDAARAVVLVEADDVLNVRDDPLGSVVGTLEPTATGIHPTGDGDEVDGSPWIEIEADGDPGWVNRRFTTVAVEDAVFADATEPSTLADALADWTDGTGPAWEDLVGPKGFAVVHFDPLKTWTPAQNPFLDPTVYDWGGEAAGPGQPVASDTFANQVGTSFAGVVGDADLQVAVDQPMQGPEAAPPFIPVPFQNFHYLAFHDPGDDPGVNGLDWVTWYVYFDLTQSGWRLVGMSLDAWAP